MYQIGVSGSSKGKTIAIGTKAARALGREIAKRGHAVFTGASYGLPYEAALGAKALRGQSVGLSPATSKTEHVKKYHMPIDAYDVIIYTGLHYVGRDLLLVQSVDAMITIGGRLGTWHEFTAALETNTPLAVLDIFAGVSTEFKSLLKAAGRRSNQIIFENDPVKLVDRLVKQLDKKQLSRRTSSA